jgi:hypothetical protein
VPGAPAGPTGPRAASWRPTERRAARNCYGTGAAAGAADAALPGGHAQIIMLGTPWAMIGRGPPRASPAIARLRPTDGSSRPKPSRSQNPGCTAAEGRIHSREHNYVGPSDGFIQGFALGPIGGTAQVQVAP